MEVHPYANGLEADSTDDPKFHCPTHSYVDQGDSNAPNSTIEMLLGDSLIQNPQQTLPLKRQPEHRYCRVLWVSFYLALWLLIFVEVAIIYDLTGIEYCMLGTMVAEAYIIYLVVTLKATRQFRKDLKRAISAQQFQTEFKRAKESPPILSLSLECYQQEQKLLPDGIITPIKMVTLQAQSQHLAAQWQDCTIPIDAIALSSLLAIVTTDNRVCFGSRDAELSFLKEYNVLKLKGEVTGCYQIRAEYFSSHVLHRTTVGNPHTARCLKFLLDILVLVGLAYPFCSILEKHIHRYSVCLVKKLL